MDVLAGEHTDAHILIVLIIFQFYFSMEKAHITLESTKSRTVDKKKKQDHNTERGGGGGGGGGGGSGKRGDDSSKFENYFNFSIPAKYAKPHQVINPEHSTFLGMLKMLLVLDHWLIFCALYYALGFGNQ